MQSLGPGTMRNPSKRLPSGDLKCSGYEGRWQRKSLSSHPGHPLTAEVTMADRPDWRPLFNQGITQPRRGKQGAINSSTRGGSVSRARPQPRPGAEHSVLHADASPCSPRVGRGAAGARLPCTCPHRVSCTQTPPGGLPIL